ncbi:Asp domain containing protein [Pyrenophora tritici-repentis]|uniref:Asp multi-domain protein n=1 Tax=Pyrenophora tritici-repentis TaxID=45151 RepID=A0A2W1EXE8_9PLEO|nr:Asp multi-domain protein [Pyrenophora tritici-repentis]KAF7571657.1 Asp multi-domain protein [Pyrenophora tritici-repentis]KAI0577819.1 Asp multi-domain protein [Pyrenophora tritici-repentis]KAI0579754.1 Asp multi-domain protein [Pyrenophora tritici-repentis]KAI0607561.1 Asp multi-domain protein [Pyrenophora tritici-repentis]
MYTPPPSWLAISALLLHPTYAFYPYSPSSANGAAPPSSRSLDATSFDSNSRSLTLPIRRVPTRRQNVYNIVNSRDPTQSNSVAIDQDGKDISYMVAVSFGDSKEEYHMLLDSAASNTWVMSQDCSTDACKTHTLFGKEDSTSLKTTTESFSITYGTGSSSGTLATDTLHLGPLSPTLTFGLATNVSSEFRSYPMDGILGLGRGTSSPSTSSSAETPQIMDILTTTSLITSKIYALHLPRASALDGELNLGSINTARFSGSINYIPCIPSSTGFWEIPLSAASVEGADVALAGPRTAIIDTGTSFILLPPADALAIHQKIKGYSQNGETFFVPCDTSAVIQFSFNKQNYNISTADWVGEKVDAEGKVCRSNVVGRQTFGEAQWLVGDVFLKNVYTVFDFEKSRVGFGVKVEGVDGVAGTEAGSGSGNGTVATTTAAGSMAPQNSGAATTSAAKAQDQQGGAGVYAAPLLLMIGVMGASLLVLM